MFKPYVTIVSNKPMPIIHLANSENSTYCQFEKTTNRALRGHVDQPSPGRFCVNCLTVREQHGEGKYESRAPEAETIDMFHMPVDRACNSTRAEVLAAIEANRYNPDPPWN
jgi:hypothetical protein